MTDIDFLNRLAPRNASAVVPSDSTTLSNTNALYVGVGGDLALLLAADTVVQTFKAVPTGTLLRVQVKKVMQTGTTATNILALS